MDLGARIWQEIITLSLDSQRRNVQRDVMPLMIVTVLFSCKRISGIGKQANAGCVRNAHQASLRRAKEPRVSWYL